MPHYKSYDSFKLKKSIEKKERIKNSKEIKLDDNFIINSCENYGVVIEVNYNYANVLYNNEVICTNLPKCINLPCNKVIFTGDKVKICKEENNYIIKKLVKRKSVLSRIKKDGSKLNDSGNEKIVATNIDIAVIVVAKNDPPLHPKFIDRYLLVLQNSNIPFVICINKCDLEGNIDSVIETYENLNIPIICTSTYQKEGISKLKTYIDGKQSIFVGNSGVGKSSLINAIMNSNDIKVSSISEKSKRGCHTTTKSKYYIWNETSSIIDTPGIRSLDLSTFEPIEIQDYFSEFNEYKGNCKYKDCLHYNEPISDCIIKRKVLENVINKNRYESYIRIISNIISDTYSKTKKH